jgi:hypothetical protein
MGISGGLFQGKSLSRLDFAGDARKAKNGGASVKNRFSPYFSKGQYGKMASKGPYGHERP